MATEWMIAAADTRYGGKRPVDRNDDRHVLTLIELTDEQYRAAALAVAARARDADDCRMLLDALGYLPSDRPPSTRLDGRRTGVERTRDIAADTLERYRRLVAAADRLHADGLTRGEAARRLGVAEATVRTARALVRAHDGGDAR